MLLNCSFIVVHALEEPSSISQSYTSFKAKQAAVKVFDPIAISRDLASVAVTKCAEIAICLASGMPLGSQASSDCLICPMYYRITAYFSCSLDWCLWLCAAIYDAAPLLICCLA
jgi:hypothetical protein